jgi:hypothetical protein
VGLAQGASEAAHTRFQRFSIADEKWTDLPQPDVTLGTFPGLVRANTELVVWGGGAEGGVPVATAAAYGLPPTETAN